MSNQKIYVMLATCAFMALVLAVAAAWRVKHERMTVDEMEQDQRSDRTRF
ncbi:MULTISPECIES: hypothetical protein [Ralstonia]|jgi:hypothetical protein|uniref:Uncharacterized protein n=1 Tax=Ralstonia pickettii OR214 TaxID=1264675 RepID=R0EE36_RALPI|nr:MULTISPECIES: hypothetical protein [Ralstonia]ENZ79592.1 hypothetical protein OR214_00008 [Ralstonia pickettii OR214]MBL4778430.1 hypothetical protein [Ralstonia sp.]MCM3582127.1 hypothetical protein [Ralstonia pickettii]